MRSAFVVSWTSDASTVASIFLHKHSCMHLNLQAHTHIYIHTKYANDLSMSSKKRILNTTAHIDFLFLQLFVFLYFYIFISYCVVLIALEAMIATKSHVATVIAVQCSGNFSQTSRFGHFFSHFWILLVFRWFFMLSFLAGFCFSVHL